MIKTQTAGIHNGQSYERVNKPTSALDPKLLRKLEARKKADQDHDLSPGWPRSGKGDTHKGKHLHTVPGSMKKGGGF